MRTCESAHLVLRAVSSLPENQLRRGARRDNRHSSSTVIYFINISLPQFANGSWLIKRCAPWVETCGRCLSRIRVRYQRLSDLQREEDMLTI